MKIIWLGVGILVSSCAVAKDINPQPSHESLAENQTNKASLASLERQIWQAYYDKRLSSVSELATAYLVSFFDLCEHHAGKLTPFYIKAMEVFGDIPVDAPDSVYEEKALPELEVFFQKLQPHVATHFDYRQVAKAELAWWVARRRLDTRDTESVGRLMAEALGLTFGVGPYFFARGAYLRAVAARYRDKCKDEWGGILNEDWQMVEEILDKAYKEIQPHLKTHQSPSEDESVAQAGR